MATILACAIGIILLWRSRIPYEWKAAGLVVAAMLSTPYLHEYDFPLLLVALAFLYRHRPFDRVEWYAAVATNLLVLVFLAQLAPIGPRIVILVEMATMRRIVQLQIPARHAVATGARITEADSGSQFSRRVATPPVLQ
ncbi:MAG TPA: hypothetical protein VHX61_12460 [Rhizomicrobium sp.]|jgi:hypothetical protein|nr:hypothetical protein [Rhizomicrobium sp.]